MPAGSAADLVTLVTGPMGVIVSVGGFLVAITQIRKVRRATEAATAAGSQAVRALTHNHVLILLPDLQRVGQDISSALDSDDRVRLLSLLEYWRATGIRARGLLRGLDGVDPSILVALTRSFTLVTEAKEAVRDPTADLVASTRALRRSIDKVVEELGDLGSQMLMHVEPEEAQ